jgi:PAS domain S-box-containing protein
MINLQLRKQNATLTAAGAMEKFFHMSLDLFCVVGQDGYFKLVNPAWKRILGWTTGELRSRPWIEFVHPDDVESSLLASETCREQDLLRFENRYRHKDGSYRWLSWNYSRYQDGCSYAIAREITEQKHTEAQLLLYQSLTKAINDAKDLNRALEVTLGQVCETTGWEYGEVWIPSANDGEIKCSAVGYNRLAKLKLFRRISEGLAFPPGVGIPGRVWGTKQPEWNQDVSIQPLSWSSRANMAKKCGIKAGFGVPILADDQVLAVLIFFTVEKRAEDPTLVRLVSSVALQLGSLMQRKQAEEQLRATNQTLQTLIQTSPLGIITLDTNANVTTWNPAAEKLFGWKEAEVLGKLLPIVPVEEQQQFQNRFRATLQGATETALELRRQKKDGSLIDVSVWTAPIKEPNGKIIGSIALLVDIGDRKIAEQERQQFISLIENSPDFISIASLEGKILFVNEAGQKLVGLNSNASAKDPQIFDYLMPEDIDNYRNVVLPGMMEKGNWSGEYRLRHFQTNAPIAVHHNSFPIKDSQTGCAIAIATITRDITEQKATESALQESEARFRRLVDSNIIGAVVCDMHGNITQANDAFLKTVGRTREELYARKLRWNEITPPEYCHVDQQALEELNNCGICTPFEKEYLRPDGSRVAVLIGAALVEGYPDTCVAFVLDISDRKRIEQAWRQSQERLRTVLENMPVMLNALDEQGRFIVWNKECERITGFTSSEIAGNPNAWELLYPNESYRTSMQTLCAERGNNYRNWEWEITCKDGTVKTIAWSNISQKFPIPGWEMWAIGVDVTERQLAKAALQKDNEELETKVAKRTAELWNAHQRAERELIERRKAEQELKKHAQVIDLANDTIAIRDLSNTITYWNTGAQNLYGWTKEEAIGENVHALLQTEFSVPLETIDRELRASGHWQGELIHTKRSGEKITVASRWTLWHDEYGQPSAILEINNDITEQKRTEAEVKKLNEDLQRRNVELNAANKELEAFCYSVSHDLRSPLRSINGFSLALQEDYSEVLDEVGKDYLRRVCAATERMGQLIDDLLSLSRITRSQMGLASVDLSAIAQSICSELQATQPERQVEFLITPGIQVQGDAKLLRVALENLLGNAWKYTSKHNSARIEFGVLRHGETASMPNAPDPTYYVRDDGAGFEMNYAEKLFAPFQRLHSITEFEGNGIGLATVQRIIHRHGGQIWASAEVEKGASFYFTLNG